MVRAERVLITVNTYVTGAVIRELREKCGMTQTGLAEKIGVCGKTVSKWETGVFQS